MTKYDFLMHYGVKGMKWGVRRYQNYDGTRIGAVAKPSIFGSNKGSLAKQKLAAERKELDKAKAKKEKEKEIEKWSKGGWTSDYNKAAESHNKTIEAINKKYDGKDLGFNGDASSLEDYVANVTDDGLSYLKEMNDTWQKEYSEIIRSNHSAENAELFIQNAPFMDEFAYLVQTAEETRSKKEVTK